MSGTWPPGRPRVLVTDAWLSNAGDAAIALAVDRMLGELAPDAAVLHAAYQADLLGSTYPDLTFAPPLATLLDVEGAPPIPPGWSGGAGARLVDEADLVLSQGGGFLLEHYQPWERLFALAGVAERGVPLVLLGQTLGHFRAARARSLLRRILRASRRVTVRDEPSRAHALELGADPDRVGLSSDPTLALFPEPPPASDSTSVGVGVVLTTHEQTTGDAADALALAAAVLAETVARAGDEPVTVASTAQGLGSEGMEDDSRAAAAAFEALPADRRSTVRVVDGHVGAEEAIALFGRQRVVVSQRLHPGLFALAQGVPAALLLDADKVGILAGADIGAFVCRAPGDDAARLRALDAVFARGAPRGAALWDALAPVRERASGNIATLAQTLAEVASHD